MHDFYNTFFNLKHLSYISDDQNHNPVEATHYYRGGEIKKFEAYVLKFQLLGQASYTECLYQTIEERDADLMLIKSKLMG
jgi:hypothetical protein